MSRVLLSGATGVVGSAILQALLDGGHEVLALARDPAKLKAKEHLSVVACDMTSLPACVEPAIYRFEPEMFIHAGWHGSHAGARNDMSLIEANMKASATLLVMAQGAGAQRVIGFGSQAEYAPEFAHAIGEEAPTQPDSAYGAAKLALCTSAQEFCEHTGMAFTWLRLFTCYGPQMHRGYIIPTLIDTMRRGEMPVLRTPNAVWDCLHADDAASGVLRVLAHKEPSGIFNLASGRGISVAGLALIIARHMDFKETEKLRHLLANDMSPATQRIADNAKFCAQFAWQPAIDLEQGLETCLKAGRTI